MSSALIVVPCYNEAERLDVDAFLGFAARDRTLRWMFVNDGSGDATGEVLDRLRQHDSGRFSVLTLPTNRGKAEAVRQGMLAALDERPSYVGYWDADLATPLAVIPEFRRILDDMPQVELVMGSRVRLLGRSIDRRTSRHYLGRVFATAASVLLDLRVYDTQCGAKLFRASDATRALFDTPFRVKWTFDVEMLARMINSRSAPGAVPADAVVYEYPLHEWRDVAGSKVRPWDFIRAFGEIGSLYWVYRRGSARGDG